MIEKGVNFTQMFFVEQSHVIWACMAKDAYACLLSSNRQLIRNGSFCMSEIK